MSDKSGRTAFHETTQPPGGAIHSVSAIAERANAIRNLYTKYGVTLNTQSGVGQLMDAVREIDDDQRHRRIQHRPKAVLLVAQLLKLTKREVLSCLQEMNNPKRILERLTQGSLDPYVLNKHNFAKDALWELEFCGWLRESGLGAELAQPDGSLAISGRQISIECKRHYSHESIEKALSKARKQIQESSHLGIVALDLEHLYQPVPPQIVALSQLHIADMLGQRNADFRARHARHINKTLVDARTLLVVYSAGGLFRSLDAPVPQPFPYRRWGVCEGEALDSTVRPVLIEMYARIMRKRHPDASSNSDRGGPLPPVDSPA